MNRANLHTARRPVATLVPVDTLQAKSSTETRVPRGAEWQHHFEQSLRHSREDTSRWRAQAHHSEVLGTLGTSLDEPTRTFMEGRFGHDFSRVRVHADAAAASSARAREAGAYTVGTHIVFGAGRYDPDSPAGRRLLVHELAHVVQQSSSELGRSGQRTSTGDWGPTDEALEREAQEAADTVSSGGRARIHGTTGNGTVAGCVTDDSVQRFSLWDLMQGDPFREEKEALRRVFAQVVERSRATSTPISVPPEYSFELIDFVAGSLAEDRMLLDALMRGPRFHQGGAILDLQPGAEAITLDRDVFVRDKLSAKTYVHEMVHVAQYGYTGVLRFLTLYFGETVARLLWHLLYDVPFDPYRASVLERQAYAVEARFEDWRSTSAVPRDYSAATAALEELALGLGVRLH